MECTAPSAAKQAATPRPASGRSVRVKQKKPADIAMLRELLFGKDYQELLQLKQQLQNPKLYSEKVAAVVSEALAMRAQQDSSVAKALAPAMENALAESIDRDPQRLANSLYPMMGPAIRKSINEVLTQTFENFNQLLEQSLSPKSLLWRFDAWRTGRSYSEVVLLNTLEYQVEQVFLIHRETGLLLRHAVSPQAIGKDPDMVSGMLTAIQDFIADSFEVAEGETLNRLKLGELTVLVEQGPYAVIAVVVRGNVTRQLSALVRETQENIHVQMAHTLKDYNGDSEPFVRIHPLLEKCLIFRRQEQKKRPPWLAYLLLAGLLVGLGYWAYQYYQSGQREQQRLLQAQQQQQAWQQSIARMNAAPGVVVVESEATATGYQVRGLLDPLAQHPGQNRERWLDKSLASDLPVTFDLQPYLSAEPTLVLQRARQALQPPASAKLKLQNGDTLVVSGQADSLWKQKLNTLWATLPGVSRLDAAGLQVNDPGEQQLRSLVQQVEQVRHEFAKGETTIAAPDAELGVQARRIIKLLAQAQQQNRLVQVKITGHADNATGSEAFNQQLALERARQVRQRLVMLGVADFALAISYSDLGKFDERSVRYQVVLY